MGARLARVRARPVQLQMLAVAINSAGHTGFPPLPRRFSKKQDSRVREPDVGACPCSRLGKRAVASAGQEAMPSARPAGSTSPGAGTKGAGQRSQHPGVKEQEQCAGCLWAGSPGSPAAARPPPRAAP